MTVMHSTHITLPIHEEIIQHTLGDPEGLHFRFLPNGLLHSIQVGSDFLVNLLLGCPVSGGLHRLYLEIDNDFICLIGPGSKATFAVDEHQAVWQLTEGDLGVQVRLILDRESERWLIQAIVVNGRETGLSCRLIHGMDIGLTHLASARNNEAYVSQYIDHCILPDPTFGEVLASRQNLGVDGQHPLLVQTFLTGVEGMVTDARDFFGRPSERTGPIPSLLQQGDEGWKGVYQREASYAGIRSASQVIPAGETAVVSLGVALVRDQPEPISESDSSWLDGIENIGAPAYIGACSEPVTSVLTAASSVHGDGVSEKLLRKWYPEEWDVEERAANGELHSFYTGDDRHVVTAAKERVVTRPHALILRSAAGDFPQGNQLSTTCYAAGIFQALLSCGHSSFNRLLSFPRESSHVSGTAGQRIWIREGGDSWKRLGIPSVFEMGLMDVRWIYRLGERILEVRVSVDPEGSASTTSAKVISGEPLEFLVTHALIGGVNELDEPAEVEIDQASGCVRVRSSVDGFWRKKQPDAEFTLTIDRPEDGVLIDVEQNSTVLKHEIGERRSFSLTIAALGHESSEPAGDGHWLGMARSLRFSGQSTTERRFDRILPWYAHNGMIHFSVPHGIEKYTGGAWGTRDVTQGAVELLMATERFESFRQVIIRIYQYQDATSFEWPQWFMLDPCEEIFSDYCHGDIPLWPLKALCDYVETSGDASILDEQVGWIEQGKPSSRTSSLFDHVETNVAWLRNQCVEGTSLVCYGDGDWNDSLQPARPELKEKMVSSWTVALCYQVLRRLELLVKKTGREINGLAGFADSVREDFYEHLVIDGAVCGFLVMGNNGDPGKLLLHPSDEESGIQYRLLPMTRAIIGGLFDSENAEAHVRLIQEHLLASDGARLMNRPHAYQGGKSEIFQRAESSSCFSREIGMMSVHAHLRYIEAMAELGRASDMLEGFEKVNPSGIQESVANAVARQANAYFFSSDAAVSTRYDADARYADIIAGKVPLEGGWRIYSSGPGIYFQLVRTRMLGLRSHYDQLHLDPVLPESLGDLAVSTQWLGRKLDVLYRVKEGVHTPKSVRLNGEALVPDGFTENPYRSGGWILNRSRVEELLQDGGNLLEVEL